MNDPLDELSTENIASFLDGYEQVTLPVGTVLHRFTQGSDASVFSDCWIDHDTFSGLITDIQKMASELGTKSDRGVKKVQIWEQFAILSVWNQLSHRVKISLKKEVIAFRGPTGPQSLYMAADPRTSLVPASTPSPAVAHFGGRVIDRGSSRGVGYVVLKNHVGNTTERLDHLTKVDVKLHETVKKGQVIGQSSRVVKLAEYRMGGFEQHVIPRFKKDEELRKVRGTGSNEAAEVQLNQAIF